MIWLAIKVEGETERLFVQRLIAKRLSRNGIETQPILVGGKGGGVTVSRLIAEMTRLVGGFHVVTSLVDYYGLGGKKGRSVTEIEEHISKEVTSKVRSGRRVSIIPYVQQYEFEGLLFSNMAQIPLQSA